ncbi:MAG TPA: MotA/TolQ/ExbB proton channel family protein [Terriglobia bacterium]|nr:MotA/TolQ/ExbB proton channel family protein [Terriglobia bacterium]
MLIEGQTTNLLALVESTGVVARIVLAVLAGFSVWSWGVILSKSLLLKKVDRESAVFWEIFRNSENLSDVAKSCAALRWTPLGPIVHATMDALKPRGGRTSAVSETALERLIDRSAARQLTMLERRLSFLATTASAAPFIGLFGTVVGVMTSFANLGASDTATLRAVAPGMAEALIATAFGLFAAIPAVIAYNHFVNRLRALGGQMNDLKAEMMARLERSEA